jgi:hypothetical protein
MNLYRVNYAFVSAGGQLRTSAIVLEAKTAAEAADQAPGKLPAAHKYPEIGAVTLYKTIPDKK